MFVARSLLCDLATELHLFGLSLPKLGPSPSVRAELVEACSCGLKPHARVEGGGRESPGVRVTFFRVAERKSPKKGRPPVCDPCAVRRGDLRRGGCGVRRGTHCAPLALRSDSHGELDNEACALRRACSPRNRPAAGAASRGGEPNSQHPNIHTGHCCARPSLRSAWRLRPRDGAERSAAKQWPEWMLSPQPLCMRRGAQWAGWHVCRRTHMHRGLARRSCLNGAPKARSEFCDAPRPRAPQVAPARSAGDADSGVALSLVTFFRRRERKLLARRATPGLRPQREYVSQTSKPRLRQAQPERSEKTIKNVATSAC